MADVLPRDPSPGWPPAFSDTFVAQARALLGRTPVLVIVGPPGSNRNRLASQIAGAQPGPVRRRHLARHGEKDLRYYALRQLVRDLVIGPHDDLPEVVVSARRMLRATYAAPPTLMLLDADLFDEPSLAALDRLASGGDVRLVATLTPETLDTPHVLTEHAERIDLAPLDDETIGALVRARFGAKPHPSVVHMLRERSQGAYGVLQEIAEAAFAAGMIRVADGVLVLDGREMYAAIDLMARGVTPSSAARLGGAEGITDLLHVAALIGEIELAEVEACFSADDTADALTHGAIRRVGDAVVFTSRAEAMLIIRTMSEARKIHLFDTYAHCVTRSMRRPASAMPSAAWWKAVHRPIPGDLARAAARQANFQGRYARTIGLTDAAELEPGAVVSPVERGYALVQLGDHRELGALLTSVDPAQMTEDELLPYLVWIEQVASGDQLASYVAAVVDLPDPEARRRRQTIVRLAQIYALGFDEAGEELIAEARAMTLTPDLSPLNRAMAHTVLAAILRRSGRPAQAVDAVTTALKLLSEQSPVVSAVHLDVTRENQVLAKISDADLPGAAQALREYAEPSARYGGAGRLGFALGAMLELYRGDMSLALANAQLCLDTLQEHDPHQLRGWMEAIVAQILVQVDRPDEARAMLVASKAHPPLHRCQNDLERRISQACAHDSLGEPEDALEILEPVIAEARAHRLRLAEIDAAVLCVQMGGPGHLDDLLIAVDDLDDASGVPAIWQTFARACAAGDTGALVALAVDLQEIRFVVPAAEVAQFALATSREDALSEETRRTLERIADPMAHRA